MYSVYLTALAAGTPHGTGVVTASTLFKIAVDEIGLKGQIGASTDSYRNYGDTDVVTIAADVCLASRKDRNPLGKNPRSLIITIV
jgi:hypothetical protein